MGVAVLMACSPTYNWRVAGHEGVPLQAMLPCKPERAAREVPLMGAGVPAVALRMASCTVGDSTFALAAAPLPAATPSPPEQAMQAWLRATWISLQQPVPVASPQAERQAPAGWSLVPLSVPGATGVQRWSGAGLDHRGQAVPALVVLASAPGWLVQAAVYGPAAHDDNGQTFVDSLKLQP